jgi:hypothetical protein
MKIQQCFLSFFLIVAALPVLAGSENCVPDRGCPKGDGPPNCCAPPPCEFWNALEEARAKERIVRTARFGWSDPDAETSQQQYEKFSQQVNDNIRSIRKTFPKCQPKGKRKNPPIFSVDPGNRDCRIMTYVDKSFRELSLLDAQQVLDGCAEVVEAKYESAYVGSTYCQLEAAAPEDRMKEQQDRATREMTFLEDQLFRYWSVCSIAPDIKAPQIIVNNSVNVLKRMSSSKKWPTKPAKRAGKPRRSR